MDEFWLHRRRGGFEETGGVEPSLTILVSDLLIPARPVTSLEPLGIQVLIPR